MLPAMSHLKTKLIAGSVAVAMLITNAAPALAWDHHDGGWHGNGWHGNNLFYGAGAGLLLGYALGASTNYRPYRGYYGGYAPPVYYQQPIYQQPIYQQPVYRQPVYVQPQPSIYNTPCAYGFQGYSMNDRRRIQSALINYGFYHGALDGSFGPGTYSAISAYAQSTGQTGLLGTQAGSAQLLAALLG